MELAQTSQLVWSEALAVRGRALAGRAAGGASGHWADEAGRERVEEVAGRMQQGDRVLLLVE